MSSTSERPTNEQTRTYDRASSVVFLKTNAPFGGLSNMAGGFPLHVQGTRIYTSEALYQACRFPHLPEVQRLIIGQASPMTAKMKSKPHRKDSRPDWDRVRVKVMRWCLRVKLAQNWVKFNDLLLRTGDRPIVEESRRDDFWGAKPVDEQTLVGMNVLGRLLMELREAVKSQGPDALLRVDPLDVPEFLLLGRPIGTVVEPGHMTPSAAAPSTAIAPGRGRLEDLAEQGSLFETPAAREAPARTYATSPVLESARLGDLKPYPAMKESGVPWLRQVPAHWSMERAKWLFQKMNRPVRDSDEVVTCFRDGTVTLRKNRRIRGFTESLKEIGYQGIRRGDLVIHAMDAFAGAIGVADADGKGTPVYSVCEPGSLADSHYYAYTVREMARSQWIQALAKGIRERSTDFRFEEFAAQLVPLPPRDEQAAIVRFLDHADRRIRRYIRAKQKLVKLLEEQKQAIIHRAVTRGLDANVRLKPSGVEWLGDVPEYWSKVPIRQLAARGRSTFVNGPFGSDLLTTELKRSGAPVIYIRDISRGRYMRVSTAHVTAEKAADLAFCDVTAGDVLVAKVGDPPGTAATYPTDEPDGIVTQDVIRIRPDTSRVIADYLVTYLNSRAGRVAVGPVVVESTRGRVSLPDFKAVPVVLPPLAEQRAILDGISTFTADIDATTRHVRRELELLREYRTRLVADVITGKLDVRDAAARLPGVTEQVEALDEAAAEADGDEGSADDAEAVPEETGA